MEVLHTSDMHWIGAARVNPSHASTGIKRRQERINKLQIVGKHTSHKTHGHPHVLCFGVY